MADKLPKYNLATAQFTPSVFQGATFKPEQEDVSLLANSLSRMEERERTANEKLAAMDVAFGEQRAKLHQDKETLDWFDNFANNYKNQVNAYSQLGDYGNAINAATRLAGEAANDAELIGRIRTSAQYKEWDDTQRARINKGISQDTYNWVKDNNKYKHVNLYDDTGNVVGAEEINMPVPYDDINFADHALAAYKMVTPDKDTKSTSSSVSTASSVDGTGGSHSSSSSSSRGYQKVRKEDILARMDELVANLPGGFSRVEQAYDVYMHKLKKMNTNLNTLKKQLLTLTQGTSEYDEKLAEITNLQQMVAERDRLMSRNGSPITDYKEFYARMVTNELLAKGLAYDWKTTETSSSKSDSNTVNNGNGGGRGSGNGTDSVSGGSQNQPATMGTEEGPTIEKNSGVNLGKVITKVATNISSMFTK